MNHQDVINEVMRENVENDYDYDEADLDEDDRENSLPTILFPNMRMNVFTLRKTES